MKQEKTLDRVTELFYRYGLLVVGIGVALFVLLDSQENQKIFDSENERASFFRSVSYQPTRVLVLVTEWCGACKSLEASLTAGGITYTRIDIEQSNLGAQLFLKAAERTRSRGVPKVIVDDNLVRPSLSSVRHAINAR
jgi:glutaredoxin